MSDNSRQYRAIRQALAQGYPVEPQGHLARHLVTLAALISGIVASKSTQLPKVASNVPDGTKPRAGLTPSPVGGAPTPPCRRGFFFP